MEISTSFQKKKLLVLYTKNPAELYNRKSAIGSYIHSLSGLLEHQFEVHLNGTPRQKDSSSENGSFEIGRPAAIKRFFSGLTPRYVKDIFRDRGYFKTSRMLTSAILNSGIVYDFILEFYTIGSSTGLQLSQALKCPLYLVYDGPIREEYAFFHGHDSFFNRRLINLEKASFEEAKKIVVYSQPMKEYCVRNICAEETKYEFHQNIDFSRFQFIQHAKEKTETLKICFVGSFLPWHRVDFLLRAFAHINRQFPALKCKLFLVGDGMQRRQMEQLASDLGLTNIEFTGFLDHHQLLGLVEQMHIGVMPGSNWYGAPNKLFEYGAMRLACIAPATPTIQYLFNQDEVCFFENNNFESFQKAFVELVQSPQKIERYANAIFQNIAKNYAAERTQKFYTELIDHHN